jgi:hypothetical protein
MQMGGLCCSVSSRLSKVVRIASLNYSPWRGSFFPQMPAGEPVPLRAGGAGSGNRDQLPVVMRAITPDTALRLARFFGNSPEFWLNLQQM